MNLWYEAARPRTLGAAVVPVLVGTASVGFISFSRFMLALTVSLGLQIGVNYANDYFDGVKGIDTPARLGPRRLTASGAVPPKQMRRAMLVALGVAGAAGVCLALIVDARLLIVGLVALAAAVGYSGGPKPYASAGLGEVFVFLFFGLVATVGSAYVQVQMIDTDSVLAGTAVGLLAMAILVANNVRDVETDEAAGKRTLAVRLGRENAGPFHSALVIAAFMAVVPLALSRQWPVVAFTALPWAWAATRHHDLLSTARLHLIFGILLAGSLL